MTIKDLTYFLHLKHERNYDYYTLTLAPFYFTIF